MRKVVAVSLGVFVAMATIVLLAHFLFGGSAHTRGDYARAYLRHLGSKVESYRLASGVFPTSLSELTGTDAVPDGQGPFARAKELVDPWGREYYYRVQPEPEGFILFSLGADGLVGGTGEDTDLAYKAPGADG